VLCYGCHILISRLEVSLIASPQRSIHTLKPARETTTGCFGVDIRTRTSEEIDTGLLGGIKERLQSKDSFGSILPGLALQQIPINIERDTVESQSLDLLEDINP
jgi:hypothetical protein